MISKERPLILGSGSPRRKEILETLGIPIEVLVTNVPEKQLPGDTPDSYLNRVVQTKWDAISSLRQVRNRVTLVADTVVVLDGRVLGKPQDARDAHRMLSALSGREHHVMTRFAVGQGGDTSSVARTVTTAVTFRELSTDSIARYVRSGEGLDKAGAYAIQGLGSFAISSIHGSYSNVVGLPAHAVVDALVSSGFVEGFPL